MYHHGNLLRMGVVALFLSGAVAVKADSFDEVRQIFETKCITCHNDKSKKGELSFQSATQFKLGSENGPVVVGGDVDRSLIYRMVSGNSPKMPKKGSPLSKTQIRSIREWIENGAPFPADAALEDRYVADADWWSLKPLQRPAVPKPANAAWVKNPIDAFVAAQHADKGLTPAKPADRRTMIRRVYLDLIGLLPSPAEVDAFVSDADPNAYEKLIDRLLDSPRYGERWARHWLDVAHYADTHGYDKDKVRANAWPYRDYVIRSLNADKPYGQFAAEQIAGDVLYADSPDGVVATGFLAAGPWDFVGQVEVANGTMEKKRVKNIDRDDMVTTAMNTFISLTVQCARCHNHKFDPILQEDYYSLQAVFAAIDRADRTFDADPIVARNRARWMAELKQIESIERQVQALLNLSSGGELNKLDRAIAALKKNQPTAPPPETGYHSNIEAKQDVTKWVQVDLGLEQTLEHVFLVGAFDNFNNIGAGFGFPVRFKIEASNDASFANGVKVIADQTAEDYANPGVQPHGFPAYGIRARYIRVTATKLAHRQNDFIFALAELTALTEAKQNIAIGKSVTALDSIEAANRWRKTNLVDGIYLQSEPMRMEELVDLQAKRAAIASRLLTDEIRDGMRQRAEKRDQLTRDIQSLPAQQTVFAAATSFGASGNFKSTSGRPRPIYLLNRGDEKAPDLDRGLIQPRAIDALKSLQHHFDLPEVHEDLRDVCGLANWITDKQNPLTWRSIVNRVWQYHFGKGIVDSPNDFGRMGMLPTHPELLDWLAVWFRDDAGQSVKALHKLIMLSNTYQQSTKHNDAYAKADGSNQFLWRFNRQRLAAEAIRDTSLQIVGKLDLKMGGPGFRSFGFKDDHSPHYLYEQFEPSDPRSWRRSVYRMIVRSVPDPWMMTLDCADPSIGVAKRNETLTSLQALAMMNNSFAVQMAEYFAQRLEAEHNGRADQISAAYRLALGRSPRETELQTLLALCEEHGLVQVCRFILNMNEFVFVE